MALNVLPVTVQLAQFCASITPAEASVKAQLEIEP